MSVDTIFGESALSEPEAVSTDREKLVLKFHQRGFEVPYIDPKIHKAAVSAALFVKAID